MTTPLQRADGKQAIPATDGDDSDMPVFAQLDLQRQLDDLKALLKAKDNELKEKDDQIAKLKSASTSARNEVQEQRESLDGESSAADEGPIPVFPSRAPSQDQTDTEAKEAHLRSDKHLRFFIRGAPQFARDYAEELRSAQENQLTDSGLTEKTPLKAICHVAQILNEGSTFKDQVTERATARTTGDLRKVAEKHVTHVMKERTMSGAICTELGRVLDAHFIHQACIGIDNTHGVGIGFRYTDDANHVLEGVACALLECKNDSLTNNGWRKLLDQMLNRWHRLLNTFKTSPAGVLQIATDRNRIVLFLAIETIEKHRPQFAKLIGIDPQIREGVNKLRRLGVSIYLGEAVWTDLKAVSWLLTAGRKLLDRLVLAQQQGQAKTTQPVLPLEIEGHFRKLAAKTGKSISTEEVAQIYKAYGNCVSVWTLPSVDCKLVVKIYDNSKTRKVQETLLDLLKTHHTDFYDTWHVEKYGEDVKIVSYLYEEKKDWTLQYWIDVLKLYQEVFIKYNWVHGDILSRNLLPGLLLDFDFAGFAGEAPDYEEAVCYPEGYNRDQSLHRHPGAQQGKPIKHVHDLYSFGRVMMEWASQQDDDKSSAATIRGVGELLSDGCEADLTKDAAAKQLTKAITFLLAKQGLTGQTSRKRSAESASSDSDPPQRKRSDISAESAPSANQDSKAQGKGT
eukprot:TRINITY_DN12532_c0_g3_i2.p1 TRINITY_DN12532_c0_g3~~TRINITY_DN12532_c0_g3_i2.p1  ORF type:complete len:680 (+),score=128.69 TRINITY_DN12532_c0_g3_i2:44-2083(+)